MKDLETDELVQCMRGFGIQDGQGRINDHTYTVSSL